MKMMRWTMTGVALAAAVSLTNAPLDAQRSGVNIWAESCANCHSLQPARRYTADQWQKVMTHMMITARLPDEEAEAILQFLRQGARVPGETNITSRGVDRAEEAPAPLLAAEDPFALDLLALQEANGARLYSADCKACHGGRGRGDGRASQGMNPRPTDISDPEYLQGVADSTLRRVIVEGQGTMAPVGRELTEVELRAIVAYIRRLGALRASGR